MNPLFDAFIKDYNEIKTLLLQQSELSFQTTIDAHFRKTFLISCASYHEHIIQNLVTDFLTQSTSDIRALSFAISKGVKRQYHTYFTWDNKGKIPNNVNNFLGLFGETFKDAISKEFSSNDYMKSNMKAFLELGNLRNLMAHENLLSFNLEKTFDELVALNGQALDFISFIKDKLKADMISA